MSGDSTYEASESALSCRDTHCANKTLNTDGELPVCFPADEFPVGSYELNLEVSQ